MDEQTDQELRLNDLKSRNQYKTLEIILNASWDKNENISNPYNLNSSHWSPTKYENSKTIS